MKIKKYFKNILARNTLKAIRKEYTIKTKNTKTSNLVHKSPSMTQVSPSTLFMNSLCMQ